jgi:hypothetical protein
VGRGCTVKGETSGEAVVDKRLVRKPHLTISRREPSSK